MSRTGGAAAIVLIATMGVVAWYKLRDTGPAEQHLATVGTAVTGLHAEHVESDYPKTSSGRGSAAMIRRPATDDRYVVKMGDPFLTPRSQEEVEWLRRNGYPSAAAREDAARSASEFDFDKRDGIEPIEILAAEQFARQHPANRGRAIEFLNEAAIAGSSYALETLARLSESPADPVTSEAYYRASALRGNWNAHMRVRPDLSNDQDMLANLLAHQVLGNLQTQRRQRGLPQLTMDARPGLEDLLRRIKEAERGAAAASRQ